MSLSLSLTNNGLPTRLIRSGRRKKRSKDKLNAVVVPSLDSEDAAGELVDGGDGEGEGEGEGFDGLDMTEAAAVDSDISVPMDAGLEIEPAASD